MKRRPYDEFIGADSTPLFVDPAGKKTRGHLLWGDGVRRTGREQSGRVEVEARGKSGWVEQDALGGESLLEVYFIDVAVGDGVLIKTPDFRHIMIDGGNPRIRQNTGKNAADFVDWKFAKDYHQQRIELDAMIASHNDVDHYGGLADLLDVRQEEELDVTDITIEAFYHGGLSWWTDGGKRSLGPTATKDGKRFYVRLLEDRQSTELAVGDGAGSKLQGNWGEFIEKVVVAKTIAGAPTPIARLSHNSGYLPGFSPNEKAASIAVLGPVEEMVSGKPALLDFEKESITTNGNSVLLRLDYGRARILLTGDLNTESQNVLLDAFSGDRLQFQCDVAKACHHGSEDVSFKFLQAMTAAVTVISSGDVEGYDHPRPRIVAASGATGHLTVENDQIITPLVYSTELARSVSLGTPLKLAFKAGDGDAQSLEGAELAAAEVEYSETLPGELRARKRKRKLQGACIVAGLIYGLVNVRTDGKTILTATMNEGKGDWAIKKFRSRF